MVVLDLNQQPKSVCDRKFSSAKYLLNVTFLSQKKVKNCTVQST